MSLEPKPIDLPSLAKFVGQGIEAEATVLVALDVTGHDQATGKLEATVQGAYWSASGTGPHYHQLAAVLRYLADELEQKATAAGFTFRLEERLVANIGKPAGSA